MRRTRLIGAIACAVGALAALPAASPAAVQVGSSGWLWGNPLPQGNTIRALSFAGPQGYAAGDFGTLLHTTDAGATWTGLLSGTFTGLTEVQAIDGDAVFAGGGCVARRSDDGGATFKRLAFTPVESSCREQLAAGWFVSRTTGYLVLTDGTVLRTDNDGDTFAQRNPLPGTRAQGGPALPTDVVFSSDQVGFAAASDGRLYRTVDGANSWTLASTANRAVRGLTFVDALHGVAAGDGGLYLTTADGGTTWTPHDLGIGPVDLASVRCVAATSCIATTKTGAQIVRIDSAEAAPQLVTPSPDPVFAAAFASPTRVVAAGASGATAVSDDAGRTFAPVGGRLTGRFLAVRAGGQAGAAFAPGENGTLARTVDGGQTWTRGNVSTSEDVVDVSFPTNAAGFALDTAGGLFRTRDGGATWRPLDTGSTGNAQAVVATSPTTVLLAGPRGVRRSTDGGDTFAAIANRAVARASLAGIDVAGSTLVAWGPRAVFRSSDRGRTWRSVRRPGRTTVARKVDFVDARTGYWLGTGGRVWRTRDGGRRWTELLGIGTNDASGMVWSSATRGYLVISRFGDVSTASGFLLRTTDAGATWHPQFVVSTPIPGNGVAAGRGGVDYLLGGDAGLLFSRSGGDAGRASRLTLTARGRVSRPSTIAVTGRLSPARGNERVTVSMLPAGSSRWQHQTVRTAATGAFTTSWHVRRGTTRFVAQWAGDFRSSGDGSAPLQVRVGARR
jgi:photosystem II stability/assembly factor-like uncharacterized protein